MTKYILISIIIFTVITIFAIVVYIPKKLTNQTVVVIGGGPKMDFFYTEAMIILKILETDMYDKDLRFNVAETQGSGENLYGLMENKFYLALANSNLAYNIYSNINLTKSSELRTVAALHTEYLIFIARKDIKSINDVKGKKISFPDEKMSNTGNLAKKVLANYGIQETQYTRLKYGYDKSMYEFLAGNLDGVFYICALPSPFISGLLKNKKYPAHPVPIESYKLKKLLERNKYLVPTGIPQITYSDHTGKNIQTIGSRTLLLTTKNTDISLIYLMTKYLTESFKKYEEVHPSLDRITLKSMTNNLPVPLHHGALKYYTENTIHY